jgi:hypothetical protein
VYLKLWRTFAEYSTFEEQADAFLQHKINLKRALAGAGRNRLRSISPGHECVGRFWERSATKYSATRPGAATDNTAHEVCLPQFSSMGEIFASGISSNDVADTHYCLYAIVASELISLSADCKNLQHPDALGVQGMLAQPDGGMVSLEHACARSRAGSRRHEACMMREARWCAELSLF